ncbi:MAG: HK97 gp10 family phage protein [Vibrio cyclitrophicus]
MNAKAQITTTMKQVEEKVNQSVVLLKKEIDANTPEDTLKLIRNNKIIPAKIIGNTVVGSVVNDTEYALYVEYGV